MTRTDGRRHRHDEGAHPDESAREAWLRMVDLPPHLFELIPLDIRDRARKDSEREKRQWRRVEE